MLSRDTLLLTYYWQRLPEMFGFFATFVYHVSLKKCFFSFWKHNKSQIIFMPSTAKGFKFICAQTLYHAVYQSLNVMAVLVSFFFPFFSPGEQISNTLPACTSLLYGGVGPSHAFPFVRSQCDGGALNVFYCYLFYSNFWFLYSLFNFFVSFLLLSQEM